MAAGMNKRIAVVVALASLSLSSAASAELLFGPRVALTVPVPGLLPELGGALELRIATHNRMTAFGLGLQSRLDGEAGLVSVDTAATWFLGASERWVPYAGGGMQLRQMFFRQTRFTSIAAQGVVGVMSSRSGSARLFVELRAVQNLLAFGPQDSVRGTPRPMPLEAMRFEPSVQAGVLF